MNNHYWNSMMVPCVEIFMTTINALYIKKTTMNSLYITFGFHTVLTANITCPPRNVSSWERRVTVSWMDRRLEESRASIGAMIPFTCFTSPVSSGFIMIEVASEILLLRMCSPSSLPSTTNIHQPCKCSSFRSST